MDFGQALAALKDGHRVARDGWNGTGMWLLLVPGSVITVASDRPLGHAAPELVGTTLEYGSHIDVKTTDNRLVPWVASQSDILADDWRQAEAPRT